jgi:hypothetical protein
MACCEGAKMPANVLNLTLEDEADELLPDTMSASTLGKIITLIEQAITAAAEEPDDEHAPVACFTNIREGSLKGKFKIGAWALPAAINVFAAIHTGS